MFSVLDLSIYYTNKIIIANGNIVNSQRVQIDTIETENSFEMNFKLNAHNQMNRTQRKKFQETVFIQLK